METKKNQVFFIRKLIIEYLTKKKIFNNFLINNSFLLVMNNGFRV